MSNLTKLTTAQLKRVNEQIVDCKVKISKELLISEDLRNNTRIAELEAHLAKLNNMVINGWVAPKFN